MYENVNLEYYNLNQLCEKWHTDLNQLLQRIETYKMRLWAYIGNRKYINSQNKELSYYIIEFSDISNSELSRLRVLSDKQLKNEGFAIKPLLEKNTEPNSYLAKKENIELIIQYRNKEKHTLARTKLINHDGYIELCEKSFISQKSITDVIQEEKRLRENPYTQSLKFNPISNTLDLADQRFKPLPMLIREVKCVNKGYRRRLSHPYPILFNDIYIHYDEVKKIELVITDTQPTTNDETKNTNGLSIKNFIENRLRLSVKENIKSINPNYSGQIDMRTREPHRLILKVMCMMIGLNHSLSDITWSSVKTFIEEHILANYNLKQLCQLEDIDDYILRVGNATIRKENCHERIPRYKKLIFANLTPNTI